MFAIQFSLLLQKFGPQLVKDLRRVSVLNIWTAVFLVPASPLLKVSGFVGDCN